MVFVLVFDLVCVCVSDSITLVGLPLIVCVCLFVIVDYLGVHQCCISVIYTIDDC